MAIAVAPQVPNVRSNPHRAKGADDAPSALSGESRSSLQVAWFAPAGTKIKVLLVWKAASHGA